MDLYNELIFYLFIFMQILHYKALKNIISLMVPIHTDREH